MDRTETRVWLARSPQRYPWMPNRGTAVMILRIRAERPEMLMIRVTAVFPRPLIVPVSAVFVYRNGQIHARVTIKFPARLL